MTNKYHDCTRTAAQQHDNTIATFSLREQAWKRSICIHRRLGAGNGGLIIAWVFVHRRGRSNCCSQ
jgi:hypothetical protein